MKILEDLLFKKTCATKSTVYCIGYFLATTSLIMLLIGMLLESIIIGGLFDQTMIINLKSNVYFNFILILFWLIIWYTALKALEKKCEWLEGLDK